MGKKNNNKNKNPWSKKTFHPDGRSGKKDKPKDKDKNNDKDQKGNNTSMKIGKSSSGSGKGNKYRPDKKLTSAAYKNIRDTQNAAKKLSKFKAPEMKVAEKKYTQTLPDRPNVSKLPTITTPGGNLGSSNVAKASGRSGTMKSFTTPVADYKNVYKNLKRTQFQKP